MKILSLILLISFVNVFTSLGYGHVNLDYGTEYGIEMLVQKNKKKTVEADTTLAFDESSFTATPDKKKFKSQAKTIEYSSIKTAEYSFAKKPFFSTGGAITSVVLLGVFAVPFLFMKKKRHWLSVQTEDSFAVLKLQKTNFRQVLAEFKTHGVEISTVDDKKNEEKKKKDKNNGGEPEAEASDTN